MYLRETDQKIANKKREVIQNSDAHLECHRKCEKCSGTGLSCTYGFDGSYSWDGVSFCEDCNGTGYIMFKDTVLLKKCPECNGSGDSQAHQLCDACGGKGILDWIQYMRMGGK